jgi:hypothetical protein
LEIGGGGLLGFLDKAVQQHHPAVGQTKLKVLVEAGVVRQVEAISEGD